MDRYGSEGRVNYMNKSPEWLDRILDDVMQLGVLKRRPPANWYEPAFNRIDELVLAGTSVREAANQVYIGHNLKQFNIEEATVRKKYQQRCQKRLADTAAEAILADDEEPGTAAIRALLEREKQNHRK